MADTTPDSHASPLSRSEIVGRFIVFQLKLAMDGIRDIILSPVSLVVLAAALIEGGDAGERHWKQLMRLGQRTDLWINLFDHHDGDGQHEPGAGAMAEDSGRRD